MSSRYIFDISRIEDNKYRISFSLGSWTMSQEVYDSDLKRLVDSINQVRGLSEIMNLFNCNEEQATKLRSCWGEDGTSPEDDCKECSFKRKECFKCQFICQSPLEKSMFLEFRKRGIDVVLQRRIRKDGTYYDYPEEIDKETILTIPDFYIESKNNKVCIYADGASYHYNNENQGIRDRTIDRELQNLGYKVIRYLGAEIRNNINEVIDSVMRSVNESVISEKKPSTEPETTGYCIRCGKPIEYNTRRPYCIDCWSKWMSEGSYENKRERFCHRCGKAKPYIYFMSPLDDDCDALENNKKKKEREIL